MCEKPYRFWNLNFCCRFNGQEVQVEAAKKVEFEKHRSIRRLPPIYHSVPTPGKLNYLPYQQQIIHHSSTSSPIWPSRDVGNWQTEGWPCWWVAPFASLNVQQCQLCQMASMVFFFGVLHFLCFLDDTQFWVILVSDTTGSCHFLFHSTQCHTSNCPNTTVTLDHQTAPKNATKIKITQHNSHNSRSLHNSA